MKKSACLMQLGTFVVSIIVVHLMWTAWGWFQSWLKSQGTPPGVLLLATLLFIPFTFGAITKLAVVIGMPKTLELVPATVEDVAQVSAAQLQTEARKPLPDAVPTSKAAVPLDALNLENVSNQLLAMGFVHIMDFRAATSATLGFARLFVHHEHRCTAELSQVFPQTLGSAPTQLTCVFGSGLRPPGNVKDEDRWGLSTSNATVNAGSGITWAMRLPRSLWTRHPGWTPEQLLAYHLEQRGQMMRDLGLEVVTGLTWEEYQQSSARGLTAQRKQLMRRPGIMIWLENMTGKKKTEWWGDYARFKAKARGAVQ